MTDAMTDASTDLAHPIGRDEVEAALDRHRAELTGYCYRMLGSVHEAEDAVQETLLRAWRAAEGYEGRASVRSWLYRIATNVSLDAIKRRKRRQRPVDLGPAGVASAPVPTPIAEQTFIEPIPDVEAIPASDDPAADIVLRESIRLAFVAALQLLPARQRAVLILREVLRWPASDVAELLETSVASVNSALQRARATLAEQQVDDTDLRDPADEGQRVLLDRYVDAFERYDLDALVSLLHEDLVMSMPPYDLWLQGPDQLREWFVGHGSPCRGSVLMPVEANASPAFAQYRPDPNAPGEYYAWAVQVLEIVDGKITSLTSFLDTSLFGRFGLPLRLAR